MTKALRKMRYLPTGDLRKRSTRPLPGETGMLRDLQSADQLIVQVDKLLSDNERLAERFAAISDVSVAVSSSLRPDDILDIIVGKARHAIGTDYCAIGRTCEGSPA